MLPKKFTTGVTFDIATIACGANRGVMACVDKFIHGNDLIAVITVGVVFHETGFTDGFIVGRHIELGVNVGLTTEAAGRIMQGEQDLVDHCDLVRRSKEVAQPVPIDVDVVIVRVLLGRLDSDRLVAQAKIGRDDPCDPDEGPTVGIEKGELARVGVWDRHHPSPSIAPTCVRQIEPDGIGTPLL